MCQMKQPQAIQIAMGKPNVLISSIKTPISIDLNPLIVSDNMFYFHLPIAKKAKLTCDKVLLLLLTKQNVPLLVGVGVSA